MTTRRIAVAAGPGFAVLLMTAVAGTQANLMSNGGMEASPAGVAADWRIQKPDDAKGAASIVDAPVRSGKRALLLKGKGLWMSAGTPPVRIDPSKSYRASAWIRTRVGHARIQLNYWAGERWLGAFDGAQRITKDEWHEVVVESDPKKYPGTTHLSIGLVSDGPEVEVYADDIVMIAL